MENLKKQKFIIDSIFVLFVTFITVVICCLFYFVSNNEMYLVANFFDMTNFELFWYFPYIVFGFGLIFFILYVVIISLKANIENKISSIFFEEGKKFKYSKDGIFVVISKDTGWTCYKNSNFVKDDFSIHISSCEILK